MNIYLIAYLIFINILAFILYGVDKKQAVKHQTRIPESVLLWMARLGGGIGCVLAMYIFHHKKKKSKFLIRIPIWIFIWLFVVIIFIATVSPDGGEGSNLLDEIKTINPGNDGI